MNSKGRLFREEEIKIKSSLLSSYEDLCKKGFNDLDDFSEEDLNWFMHIHNRYLNFYMEERRMHFGAMALVAFVMVILIFPALSLEKYFNILGVVVLLLSILLAAYLVVYRRYEEGVRKKMREAIILENAIRKKIEN